MNAEEYNHNKMEAGMLTLAVLTQLVKEWQKLHGLVVDGKCGPITLGSLASERSDAGTYARAIVKAAQSQIGMGEEGGNNSGAVVAKYKFIEDDGDDDDDGAWCANFVSWCCHEAAESLDAKMPFRRSSGAKRLYRHVLKVGTPVKGDPKPGDIICWDRGKPGSWQGHIGIVETYAEGVVHTIEGNVGRYPARVRRFTHDLDMQTRLEGIVRVPEPKLV